MTGYPMEVQETRACETDGARPSLHKAYRVTDPDGNADRLFTFQKEVEKARARIKKG